MPISRYCGLGRLTRFFWETKFYWTPKRFSIPLSDVEIDRPVFLLGTQGGGVTLLARILRRHSQSVYCSGNPYFWAGRDEMQNVRYEELPQEFRLGRLAELYKMPKGKRLMNHTEFGYARNFIYACDDFCDFYRKTEKDYSLLIQERLQNTIKRCIRAYAQDVHHCRFIDKSQSYTLKVPLLRRCLSNPKFVLVSRDPFALCARYCRKDSLTVSMRQWRKVPSAQRLLDVSIEHWKNTFSIALNDLKGRDDSILVRFEDFLASPEKTLTEILAFLEMPLEEGLSPGPNDRFPLGSLSREKWYPLKKNVNQKYLEQLDVKTKDYIKQRLGDIASQIGYE